MKKTMTENEKKVLKGFFEDGYAYDGGNFDFLSYGGMSKSEGGTITSLQKKGFISVLKCDGEILICTGKGYSLEDLAIRCGARVSENKEWKIKK